MKLPRLNPYDVLVAWIVVLYVVLLVLLPFVLSRPDFDWAFSESGPFERLSIVAWLLIPLIIFWRIRPLGMRARAFALLGILFAAREAEWHKAFTADSILKTNYYRHAAAPFEEKVVAATVALLIIALLLYLGFVVAKFLLQGGWRSRSGLWLIIGTLLVVAGKVLDRAPAVLFEEFGLALPHLTQLYATAFEEGLELMHPLILGWSVWISQKERRYLS